MSVNYKMSNAQFVNNDPMNKISKLNHFFIVCALQINNISSL